MREAVSELIKSSEDKDMGQELVECNRRLGELREELAMFLHLYRLRYKIEVYPGSDLEIVEATCAGRFANFPVPSLERSHVSLELTCP